MRKILSTFLIALVGVIAFNACQKDINHAIGTINPYASLYVMKSVYQGSDVQIKTEDLNGAVMTGGVVISNNSGLNFPAGSVVIQNTTRGFTRGIIIDITTANLAVGDSVNINVIGATLKKVGSSLHLAGISEDKIKKISSGIAIPAKSLAMGELVANFGLYESTLVKITADTKPLPATGEKYVGAKTLTDGGTNTLVLYTQTTASFANNGLPASATYSGIPTYGTGTDYGTDQQLRLRTIADVENASGPIYAGWPESFETPDATVKASYNMNTAAVPDNTITLKTGAWKLEQAILGNLNANRDRFNAPGLQCIRLQQSLSVPGYVQMNFDLPNGASKLTLWQGAYSTDVSSTFKLQHSIDGGITWIDDIASGRTTANIATLTAGSKQETYLFNITGNVRFRVMKLGLGTTSVPTLLNGRLCIEDIAVYSN